jgi:NTE family protein
MGEAPSIGLALGSGSARGWAHIGVIRGLQRERIPVHLVCGTSIGAVVAAAMAAGTLDALESTVRALDWSDVLRFLDIALPRSGLIEGERLLGLLREYFADQRIENLRLPFAAVATELASGREVWLRQGPLLEAVRASISMPGIFAPTSVEGRWLVDGGLVNPVPVSLCRAMGANIVIAVNLNTGMVGRHMHPRRVVRNRRRQRRSASGRLSSKITSQLNHTWRRGKSLLIDRFGLGQTEDRSPTLFETLITSIHIMQDRITRHRLAGDPPEILISPPLAHIGLLEFKRADEVIQAGEQALQLVLPLLRKLVT